MCIRDRYQSGDCRELAELFYNTVHGVNCRDYTKEQLDAWACGLEMCIRDRAKRMAAFLVALLLAPVCFYWLGYRPIAVGAFLLVFTPVCTLLNAVSYTHLRQK